MKDQRSASQILYGYLPEQTVDVRGGIWKVKRWHYLPVNDVDDDALRTELIKRAAPWAITGRDGDLVDDLRRGSRLQVRSLDRDAGVWLEPFPLTWRCKKCSRLLNLPRMACSCGSRGPHGQLPFVLYHDECGAIRQPTFPRCPVHNDVRMILPGTTSLQEIRLECPSPGCGHRFGRPFLFTRCTCGLPNSDDIRGNMRFTVHRGASVYVPRGIVIVNPPSRHQQRRLHLAGGKSAALSWVADSLEEAWVDEISDGKTAALRRFLLEQGRTREEIDALMAATGAENSERPELDVCPSIREEAEADAVALALAMSETRQTLRNLRAHASEKLAKLYDEDYPLAMRRARVQRVDLVERFPILTGRFGFSRGSHEPGESRLRGFVERDGTVVVYGDLATSEALVVRLDPITVAHWLVSRGHSVGIGENARDAYEAILQALCNDPAEADVLNDLETLIHSYSHRMVRQVSFYAGIDRESLSELLFPKALSFVTYAVPRGDFVLGGLQAMVEYDLHTVLDRIVHEEWRCALDPGCWDASKGAACAVCLHLGEPSCRMFNTQLDRKALFGEGGFFAVDL